MVLAVLYGAGRLAYSLMGVTVGTHYYASLAEKVAPDDTVDFTALAAENPEIRAWVRLEDTAIDLPVVETTDNSFYLTHRFDEKRNKLGTPFIDAGNAGDFSDRHTVIYGHAVSSGALFGSLWEYENPNYYTRHPEIQLFLPSGEKLTLAVFACVRVEKVRSAIPIAFSDEASFLAFIDDLHEGSAFTSNVKITSSDRIVSFCIVLPDGGEGRLLVSCKIVEDGSVTTVTPTTTEETAIVTATEAPTAAATEAPTEAATEAPVETPAA